MKPEGSLPHSQVPATCPYSETARSHFLKIHLNIILPSMPGFPKLSLSFRFPRQNLVYASPLPHTRYRVINLVERITLLPCSAPVSIWRAAWYGGCKHGFHCLISVRMFRWITGMLQASAYTSHKHAYAASGIGARGPRPRA